VAACLGLLATCGGGDGGEVTPPPAQPVSMSISGLPTASMLPGQSAQLTATLTYSDSSTRDVTATANWSTTNTSVLSVSAAGAIVAVAPGQADVVASAQGLSSRQVLRVEQPSVPQLTLFAGSLGGPGYVDGSGAAARFNGPTAVAADGAGNVYIADSSNAVIRKVKASGEVSTLAGTPRVAGSADGPAAEARFNEPLGVAVDESGNVYVADTFNHSIRKIMPDGMVSTVAGVAGEPGSADGTVAEARFHSPQGVAVDGAGNVYVADTGNYTIRRITPAGQVSTVAGAPGIVGSTDGPATAARFGACHPLLYGGEDCWGPAAVAIDRFGNLLVADAGNFTIRVISPASVVSTLPGSFYGCTQGMMGASRCIGPTGVAVDRNSFVYVVVANSRSVHRIASTGAATLVPGVFEATGSKGQFFNSAGGIATDNAGNVYVPDMNSHTIRKLPEGGEAVTLAGSALMYGYADGSGDQARFGGCIFIISVFFDCQGSTAATVDSGGNVYVADRQNHIIRRITPAGTVSTLAGRPGQNGSADGSLQDATFYLPTGVTVDGASNLYVSDSFNSTIRRISPAGQVTTLAGEAGQGGSSDGVGSQARFLHPSGVAMDGNGNLFVADSGNSTIRRISPAGEVTTLAGEAGQRGSSDGTGAQARFDLPDSGLQFNDASGLATDGAGNVYVADTNNHTIRRITPEGVVTTLAGSAGERGSTDGIGAEARFDRPQGLATDGRGNVYVADTGNHTIRKITADGAVSTVVGRPGDSWFLSGSLPGGLSAPLDMAVRGTSLYVVMPNGVAVVTNVP